MPTRDELAAIECHKQAIRMAIQKIETSTELCASCGMADLLRVELWKLDHPISIKPISKTAAGVFSAVGAGVVLAIAKIFGLKWD